MYSVVDFIFWWRLLLEIFNGWVYDVILFLEVCLFDIIGWLRCFDSWLLNDLLLVELFCIWDCKFLFFWLFIVLYECSRL